MNTSKRIRSTHLLFFISMALLSACSDRKPPEKNESAEIAIRTVTLSKEQSVNAGIRTDTMVYRVLESNIQVNGMIDVPPQNMVSVSMPMGGFLRSTQLLPGMAVRKGEPIATMEDPQYIQLQQDFLTARARLEFDKKEFERQSELNRSKASSDKTLEQAKADYLSTKILIRALSEKLRLIGIEPDRLNEDNISRSIEVRSPIHGFVSKVRVNVGRYVNPSDVMFELVDPSDIHLNLTVYEKDLSRIRIGNPVRAFTNNQTDKIYLCDVILIGKDVSREGFVEVHCHFDTYDKALIPGMYMNAEVETGSTEAYTVPESSVMNHLGSDYVFLSLGAERYQMQKVRTGARADGMVQILEPGLLKGKPIVVNGAFDLLMMFENSSEE